MAPSPTLFVHDTVLCRLAVLAARPWEVGGWLLGYWADDRRSLFVTHLTPPTGGRPWQVTISGRGHRRYFDEAWEASSGAVTFLGDWHTHPGAAATPSRRDRQALTKLATEPDYGTPRPLAVIVKTARWPWRQVASVPRFYLGNAQGETVELAPRAADNLHDSAARVPVWPWPRAHPPGGGCLGAITP
jgi:integrative and conjugative element protein (TIGR02256 family)